MKFTLTAVALLVCTTPIAAQWMNHPTAGIPRNADGKPNLSAPAPRSPDGKPDFTGLWLGLADAGRRPDPGAVQPWVKDVVRQREEDYFKSRPSFQCLPGGPEAFGPEATAGFRRIIQTPMLIAILNADRTYREIFMDGRELEPDPLRNWMGYSVGRWEGDTLTVDSFGFNDKTWLAPRGFPHTEALRVRERYRRRDFGHLQIEVTFTDPAAYVKPWGFTVNMELAPDTEMLEAVCETRSDDHWVGRLSDARTSKVSVAPDVLASYVGVYSGVWAGRPRTVEVTLSAGQLVATVAGETFPLMARSQTLFETAAGLGYRFVRNGGGPATHVVEMHVSGDYEYPRRR